MRAAHRAAEKVCSTDSERKVFTKLAGLLPNETYKNHVNTIFIALKGETQLKDLPSSLKLLLPANSLEISTSAWVQAKTWVHWWTRPIHLSECIITVTVYDCTAANV